MTPQRQQDIKTIAERLNRMSRVEERLLLCPSCTNLLPLVFREDLDALLRLILEEEKDESVIN
ncbi:MAG: hypothetical protein RLZZ196_1730 [Bacteroidota bacterium]|jgi:hypothetical protein